MKETALDSPQVPSDEELLQRIRDKDVEALEALYERYKRQGFGLAYRVTSSQEVAEEVLQDAFLAIWQRASTYDSDSGLVRPWLFSIIHHRAVDHVRRPSARKTSVLDEALLVPGSQDVFSDVYARLSRDEIRGALGHLPDEQKQALELLYFGGLTFTQIAQSLDLPVGTVKSRVRLALGKLRSLLEPAVEP